MVEREGSEFLVHPRTFKALPVVDVFRELKFNFKVSWYPQNSDLPKVRPSPTCGLKIRVAHFIVYITLKSATYMIMSFFFVHIAILTTFIYKFHISASNF